MTQKEMVLEYLEKHGTATMRQLRNDCREWINSPAEYISQLRADGHDIETITANPTDKHGTYVYRQPKPNKHRFFELAEGV